jgi:hypothetical protein
MPPNSSLPLLLRDSSLDAALPDRLLTHHPPSTWPIYTASTSCDVSDRGTSVRRTPSNSQSFESITPLARRLATSGRATACSAADALWGCENEHSQAHGRVGV